ncbi:MAG TPA: hypothetical protein VG675_09670 [Bryobacteraceae bacterium]|nr:hypothetical protein [Bryobacteraceae bacterium]
MATMVVIRMDADTDIQMNSARTDLSTQFGCKQLRRSLHLVKVI